MAKISTKEIREGKHTGKKVWICDYRQPDIFEKPLRNVSPVEVLICSNDELPKNKTVYYSKDHFKPLNKNGDVIKSKIISPVDNTGFRAKSGNELYAFDNEKQCIEQWNELLNQVSKQMTKYAATASKQWNDKALELTAKKL